MIVVQDGGPELYWRSAGPGADVVLVHGLLCDHQIFNPQAEALYRAGYRVTQMDLRGHGRSTRAPTGGDVAPLIDDVLAVADAAGVTRGIFVGLGFGGYLTLRLARDFPSRVAGMALWSVDPRAASTIESQGLDPMVRAARGITMRAASAVAQPLLSRLEAKRRDPYIYAMYERSLRTASMSGVQDVAQAYVSRPDLRADLPSIDVPTQVLWGGRDVLVRQSAGLELLAQLPKADGGPVPGAQHLLHLDQPAVVNEALLNWLQRNGF